VVQARARQLGLSDALRLPGFVPFGDPLLHQYTQSDIFVHIAVTEAMGQVLLEAHARGLPVIGTDVGGVRAVLDGGRAGMLVPPGEPAAVAIAIRDLAADADRRRTYAQCGLELAQERTLERTAARTATFLAGQRVPECRASARPAGR
jgi:glycosyltransferase involved in cell wall biosynthesis